MATEGSNDLKEFLKSKKSKLKDIDEMYEKLKKADIDCEELSILSEIDLRETLNEVGLKKIQVGRLISVLRSMDSTQIYKESENKKVVVLSGEEGDALHKITKKCKLVKELMKFIETAQNKLQQNCNKNSQKISDSFDEIIKCMNIRREALLNEINKISDSKTEKLVSQKKDLSNYVTKLTECNLQVNKMIRNSNITKESRKKDILSATHHILYEYDTTNENLKMKLAANPNFKVMINVDTVNEMLDKIGEIQESHVSKKASTKLAKHKTNALQKGVSVSEYSMKWDFYNKRYARFVANSGCTFERKDDKSSNHVTVACSNPCKPDNGIYEWAIGCMGRADHAAIGIASDINHLKNDNLSRSIADDKQFGNAYFLMGSGRIMSGAKCKHMVSQWYVESWKKDDIVKLRLDMDNYKLMFFINKEQVGETIHVAKGCKYYPVLCTQTKNVEFIII